MLFSSLSLAAAAATVFIASLTPANASPCDTSKCIHPACVCPSTKPPKGMDPQTVPQFVTLTFDDAVQTATVPVAKALMAGRKNPNGCPAPATWFAQILYSDFALIQQWYAAGNEVADHTMTHVGTPPLDEIIGNRMAINSFAGVPFAAMTGFRAPFLNYSADTFTILGNQKFEYDSSTTATPADAHWPYTLDYGLANDCWDGICEQPISIPGLWEIPMAAIMDGPSTMAIPHNMDPQLDGTPEQVAGWLRANFDDHYKKDRQPFGIYLHPVHVGNSTSLYTTFLNEIAALPNVWFVTNQQLLAWMKNPVPATQLADQPYMKCERPVVGKEICNGIEDSTVGVSVSVSASVSVNGDAIDARVLETCNFVAGAWSTCYGCPKSAPSAADPVPPRILAPGTAGARTPVPTTCAMEWWDPIAAQCLCTSSNCTFNDIAQTPKTTSGTGSGSGTNKGSDAVFLAPSLSAGLGVLAAVVAAGAAQWL